MAELAAASDTHLKILNSLHIDDDTDVGIFRSPSFLEHTRNL